MHKTLPLILLIVLINQNLFGQNSDLAEPHFFDNVRFGGGVNIGLGSNYSTFAISPSAIYDFSDQFSAGFGVTYVYLNNKSTVNITTNLYGGSILAFYKPISQMQISTEYENLKINQNYSYEIDQSQWQKALYFGVEYVTGNISMGLRYDVLYDKLRNITNSSALNPVFRVYF